MRSDALKGHVDLLLLSVLEDAPAHGYRLAEALRDRSEATFDLAEGTLYPALYRLERQGLIRSDWRVTENSRRARYYSLTPPGRRHLNQELAEWRRMSRAINLVLGATLDGGGA